MRVPAALESALARLGPFSPLVTLRTFSPGARTMLRQTERSADLALHVVRAAMWLLLVPGGLYAWSFPVPLVAFATLALATVWSVAAYLLLRPSPAPIVSYVLTTLDVYLLTEGAFATVGPLAGMYTSLGATFGIAPRPAALAAFIPPLYVYLALSGALRVDPRKAFYSAVLALVGYTFFASVFATSVEQALVVGATVAVAGIVATNGARVLRYHVLKAREESVLEGFVPSSLTSALARTGTAERAAREDVITLFLSDIRGFTRFSAPRPPQEVVALLDEYFAIVTGALGSHGAVVDKYIGDGILAFFEGAEHERRAYAAAREALAAIAERNAREDVEPLRIGIGLHTGAAMLGTIGAPQRRDYTVISDAVNVTARLEELNKTLRSELVLSDATAAALLPDERAALAGPQGVAVRGRDEAMRVYAFGSLDGTPAIEPSPDA